MRRVLAVLGLSLALATPAALDGQTPAPDTPVSSTADPVAGADAPTTAGTEPAPEAAPAHAGLPAQAPPPRTLRAYWHLFAAFAVTWLLLFGYAVSLGRRFGALERELRRLGGPAAG